MRIRDWFLTPLLGLVLFLGACATSSVPELARMERVTSFCEGFTSTLNTLSTMNELGQLSEGQVGNVDLAVMIMDPVCRSDADKLTQPLLETALEAIIVINSILEAEK